MNLTIAVSANEIQSRSILFLAYWCKEGRTYVVRDINYERRHPEPSGRLVGVGKDLFSQIRLPSDLPRFVRSSSRLFCAYAFTDRDRDAVRIEEFDSSGGGFILISDITRRGDVKMPYDIIWWTCNKMDLNRVQIVNKILFMYTWSLLLSLSGKTKRNLSSGYPFTRACHTTHNLTNIYTWIPF